MAAPVGDVQKCVAHALQRIRNPVVDAALVHKFCNGQFGINVVMTELQRLAKQGVMQESLSKKGLRVFQRVHVPSASASASTRPRTAHTAKSVVVSAAAAAASSKPAAFVPLKDDPFPTTLSAFTASAAKAATTHSSPNAADVMGLGDISTGIEAPGSTEDDFM